MERIDLSGLDIPEKELKILESAINVFSEKGFSAATTSEIAKEAGVAEGTIFRYFKTKKDILRGILIHTISILSSPLVLSSVEKILQNADGKDLRTILREFLLDRMKLVDSIFPMARVLITEALFHEDVRNAVYENIISKAIVLFTKFYEKLSPQGVIRSDIGPEALLRSLFGNMIILIMQNKLFSDKSGPMDIDKEIEKVIDIILYGISEKKEVL